MRCVMPAHMNALRYGANMNALCHVAHSHMNALCHVEYMDALCQVARMNALNILYVCP